MPILNESSFPFKMYLNIRKWDDNDYWFANTAINQKLVIPDDIVSGNTIIVVCTAHEAYTEIVGQIYDDLVIGLSIAPKRILLLSENADLTELIIQTAKEKNRDIIQYEWTLVFQNAVKAQTITNLKSVINIRPKSNTSSKYFLNFNRRWRKHRPTFVALLYASGLLDKGHVSLAPSDGINDNWTSNIDVIKKLIKSDDHLINLINNHVDKIKNLQPLYLDTKVLNVNRARLQYDDIDVNTTINLYKDTMFSIVSETYFFEKVGRFITEKTFKPIAYHHPFILITEPFSLELLRDLGYKTFDPFIDESYDREIDNAKRIRMILHEVERLCKMNPTEMDMFLKNVQSITDHNFKQLLNSSLHIHKKL